MSSEWAHFEDEAEAKGYAQISNALLRSPHISLQAKGFYALLKSYAWQDPTSFPGVKRLREDTGASDNTLKKYRDELIKAGLLVVKRRGRGKTNLYVFKSVSEFLESHTGDDLESHTGANNEDSVEEDSVTNPTGGKAPSTLEEVKRTESQKLTDDFYNRVKGRYKVSLEPEQYSYHLGHFRNMLKKSEPTEDELLRVISYMVDRYPASPKIRATTAIQDVRLGRDTGEAWEGPAPWEKKVDKSSDPESVASPPGVKAALLKHDSLDRYAYLADQWDFTKQEPPPYKISVQLGGDQQERWQNQDRIMSIARRTVKAA